MENENKQPKVERKDQPKVEKKEQPVTYKYVYGISFKNALHTYYFGSNDDTLAVNDMVVVETARGIELGKISVGLKNVKDVKISTTLKPILHKAKEDEIAKQEKNAELAKNASEIFRNSVVELKLNMILIFSEYTLDASKVIFTYVSDERVDFRELLKILASKLKCRIELKQIGARDRSKAVGGLGPCGLPLCCSTFLSDFEGISINMAKNQLLALNIQKLSGQCGKLICCLKYEDSVYSELKVGLPKLNSRVNYNGAEYKITAMNVLTKTMKLETREDIVFITFDEYFKEIKKNEKEAKLSK